jgi:diacylglycerol O-acyltransferase / wax synthase
MDRPKNLMMVGSLAFFDGPIDVGRLTEVMDRRLARLHPHFRQRVVELVPGIPLWGDEDAFNIRDHIHHVALPSPGDDAALRELTGDLMSTPLTSAKSPWDVHVIDGYGRRGSVVLTRLHHCMGDGTSLVRAMEDITDRTPAGSRRNGQARKKAASPRRGLDGLLSPVQLIAGVAGAAASVLTLGRLILLSPDPDTPLRGELGLRKQVAWTKTMRLDRLRGLRRRTGCTVNDIMVTAVTGALRRHIGGVRSRSVPKRIRALVPVDIRATSSDHAMTNYFGLVFADLPIGVADPWDRLEVVHEGMSRGRNSPEPSVTFEVLAALGLAPSAVQRLVTRFFGSKATVVITNVQGPPQGLYLAGSPMKRQTFFVPQSAELGIGFSIYSYAGNISVGVIADSKLVPKPQLMAQAIEMELENLMARRTRS